jgi:outer membrane protein assembly factor BamB
MKHSALLLAALAASLTGCNWIKSLGKKDNVEPPTPLTELVPTAQVERVWGEGVGSGAGSSGVRLAPVVADGRLFAAAVDGTVEAVDAATGRSLWQKRVGERHGMLWSRTDNTVRWAGGPAVDGDLLVVGGLDGQIYALSAQDGSERWSAQLSSEVVAAPAIANGTVVVRTNDGRLVGLSAADGSRKWIFEQPVPTATYLMTVQIGQYDDDRVALGTTPGRLFHPRALAGRVRSDFGETAPVRVLIRVEHGLPVDVVPAEEVDAVLLQCRTDFAQPLEP